jgi:O-antigen/teichoic acid export membrane protein
LSIIAIISYLALLDLGGQSYIGNLLAIEWARKDKKAFQRVLSESVSFFVLISVVALATILLLLVIWSDITLLSRYVSLGPGDRWVVILIATNFLIAIPGGVYVKIYQSCGLFARAGMIGNTMQVVSLGLLVLLLYEGVTPPLYAAGVLLTGIMTSSVIIWDSRRQIDWCRNIHISIGGARKAVSYLGASFYFWLISLAQALKLQGILLVLATFASPVAVALYATHRLLSNAAAYVGSALNAPLWPELTFLWADKQYARLERVILLSIKLVVFLGGVGTLLVWIAGPVFYSVWTRNHLQFVAALLAIMMIQSVLVLGYSSTSWVLMSTNCPKAIGICYTANAVLTIGLSILFVKPFGVEGVAVATMAGDIVFGLAVFPILTSSLLRAPARKIYGALFSAFTALVPFAAAAGFALTYGKGWWSVLCFLVLSAGLVYPVQRLLLGKAEMERLICRILDLRIRSLSGQRT